MSKKIFICVDHIDGGVWWLSDQAPSEEDLASYGHPEASIIEIDTEKLEFEVLNFFD